MYVGHLATGFAIKARFPEVPALPIMVGVGVMDIINGLFVLLGIDKITPDLNAGPYVYFELTFIDWDHSLVTSLLIACAWAALFLKHKKTAFVAGLAAFSHWLTDLPMHNSDLALFPHSSTHFGWGLWGELGIYSWLLEGVFASILAYWAWKTLKAKGIDISLACGVLFIFFIQLSPWLSPTRFAAGLDEPAAHLLAGVLITLGFVIPGALFTWLFNRAERLSGDN